MRKEIHDERPENGSRPAGLGNRVVDVDLAEEVSWERGTRTSSERLWKRSEKEERREKDEPIADLRVGGGNLSKLGSERISDAWKARPTKVASAPLNWKVRGKGDGLSQICFPPRFRASHFAEKLNAPSEPP